jgi:hypothetical protein
MKSAGLELAKDFVFMLAAKLALWALVFSTV